MQQNQVKSTVAALTLLILTTVLSSCSTTPEVIQYRGTPINRPELILPDTTTLDLRKVDFLIVTRDNIEEVFAELERTGQPIVLMSVTSDGYTALSLNIADILELVSQQKSVILAYRNYYEQADRAIVTHNSSVK